MSNINDNFLIKFQEEMQDYLKHIETSMLDLLKLYISLFMLLGPVLSFLKSQNYISLVMVAIILFIIAVLGFYILQMYLELRIRKIKVLEQIVVITGNYKKSLAERGGLVTMIDSIEAMPPYLRRPSSEWYTVLFLSFLNSLAMVFSLHFIQKYFYNICFWINLRYLLVLIVLLVALFILQFIWSTRYTFSFDMKREFKYNKKNKYEFLDPWPYFPSLFKPFHILASWVEHQFREKYQDRYKKNDSDNVLDDDCLFCKILKKKTVRPINLENDHFISVDDKFPVSKGHALIISKRHINSIDDLSNDEIIQLFDLVKRIKKQISNSYNPAGFNFGVNEGVDAGQSIMHLHFHLIPRYKGDTLNPKGGIRGVIPEKMNY